MHHRQNNYFVITGGPGAGKSTLLDHLERAGLARSQEAGRGVIQDQVAIGGQALPWADRSLFAELMLGWELRSLSLAAEPSGRPVLFDRGIPDVAGYLRLEGLPVPDHVWRAAERFRYNRHVFIARPWREIYRQDAERKQDFSLAVRTCEVMAEVYAELGYRLIELPRGDVEARAAFLRARLAEFAAG